jgi:hypothetical protein
MFYFMLYMDMILAISSSFLKKKKRIQNIYFQKDHV